MRSSAVSARAELVAARVSGRTRFTVMRSQPPLTFRSTPDAVYVVGSAAGPLGGDDLHVTVEVGAGASVVVRSTAATIALPGAHGGPSHLTVDLTVEAGGTLHWLPEPLLVVAGADLRMTTRVRLHDGAALVLRDHVVLGRHDEISGSLFHRLRVDVGGRPLVRNDVLLGPRWPEADGPAGVGGARQLRHTLQVGGAPEPGDVPRWTGVRRAVMALRDGAWLTCELGFDPTLPAVTVRSDA